MLDPINVKCFDAFLSCMKDEIQYNWVMTLLAGNGVYWRAKEEDINIYCGRDKERAESQRRDLCRPKFQNSFYGEWAIQEGTRDWHIKAELENHELQKDSTAGCQARKL